MDVLVVVVQLAAGALAGSAGFRGARMWCDRHEGPGYPDKWRMLGHGAGAVVVTTLGAGGLDLAGVVGLAAAGVVGGVAVGSAACGWGVGLVEREVSARLR